MKIPQDVLIDSLKKDVSILIDCVHALQSEKDALLVQPAPGSWSAAQALEHVNRYGQYYLPQMDKAISLSTTSRQAWFHSGVLGNWFTKLMQPKSVFEVKNKLKAMKGYIPDANLDADKVLLEFEQQQNRLLQLLELSRSKNLNAIRVPVSISKVIKLKLGDTFRFLIAHEQRHMIQARNAIKAAGVPTDKFPAILQAVQQ